jgi:excisionase family DNA binding protein
MSKFIKIKEAALLLGVAKSTLRRWENSGKLIPERTAGNQRRYRLSQIMPHVKRDYTDRKTIGYARVSSKDQKKDLIRQQELLEMYCTSKGWCYEIITDLGSGMNYQKRGLKKLLSAILDGHIGRLVITHKDRLLRFGAELVFSLCEQKEIEVVIINKAEEFSFEEELAKDVLEIITVFSARLYGSRSRKNQKLILGLKEAIDVAGAED